MSKIFVATEATQQKILEIVSSQSTQGGGGEVYGFIEHMAVLAPGQRIDYLGENTNYSPIYIDKSTGESTLNSWAQFPLILKNKPWMVHSDGTPDYMLDDSDYTKKIDGTTSDITNASYAGGAFSWLQKIYKYEEIIGNDRIVKFSFNKMEGFEPIGYIDSEGNELEGVWIPMFYGSIDSAGRMTCISGNQPIYSKTTEQEKAAIDKFGTRARFFGGSIINTIIDLLIMFAKTTDLQTAYGDGCMSAYNSSESPTYGVKANAVVTGGQFYGTSGGKTLNKIFHSIVLGSYQQYMRDPYTILINGELRVSPRYIYDVTGETYEKTGIKYSKSVSGYPHKYKKVEGFGCIPDETMKGTSSTGGCDYFSASISGTKVAIRFGYCSSGTLDGPRGLYLSNSATDTTWSFGAAILLLPPVGAAA